MRSIAVIARAHARPSLRAPVVCHRTNMEDHQCQQVLIDCQAAVTAYSSANSIVLQLFAVQILLNCTATQ
eukprot:13946-Heterococcus_DN1.PRE.3